MTVATWFNPGLGAKRPVLLHYRASKHYILFVVAFAVFTDMFLYGMIVPVAPNALEQRVGLTTDDQQRWTSILLALYGASLLAVAPLTGYVADRIESRQWPLLGGLVALGVGTALLTVGTNIGLWIAGRILQGASTAVVWTAGLALLADTMDSRALGQSMGYVGMAMTLGLMAGPLVGGALYQHGGYYSVFGLAFGLIGLDILARLVMIERKHAMPWFKAEQAEHEQSELAQDEPSAEKPSNVTEAPHQSGDSTPVPDERRRLSGRPFGRIRTLLSSPRMIVVIWTYMMISVVLTSFDSVLPLFVLDTFDWQQTAQGLIFIPISIPSFLDPIVGRIIDRFAHSCRYICAAGLFCSVPVLVCLRFVTDNTINDKVLLCALLVLIGFFIAACMMPPTMVEVSAVVHAKEKGNPDVFGQGGAMALAYGVLNSAWAAGSIVGPFFAGYIRDDAGWGTMAWAMSILTGLSGIPVLLYLGGFIGKRKKSAADAGQA